MVFVCVYFASDDWSWSEMLLRTFYFFTPACDYVSVVQQRCSNWHSQDILTKVCYDLSVLSISKDFRLANEIYNSFYLSKFEFQLWNLAFILYYCTVRWTMNFNFVVLASRGENIEVQMADVEASILKICHKRRKVCTSCAFHLLFLD